MKLSEEHLKQIIREEVERRIRLNLIENVLSEEMPNSWKRAGAILGIGAGLGLGTWFGGEYASYAQEKGQEAESFRSAMQTSAEKVKGLKNFMEISSIPDATGAPVGKPVGDTMAAMENFKTKHATDWNSAHDKIVGGRGLPNEKFFYVPASQIPDNEVLPFVGMTKGDYETLLRAFYLDDPGGKGDERLKSLVLGDWDLGSSMYWAYGGGNNPLFGFWDSDADSGQRGMMLPPEWSVAYDLLQKRQAKASGVEMPAPEQDLSIPLDQTTWKEMKILIKKELAKLL